MGIISPQKMGGVSKVLWALLLIAFSPILVITVLLYLLWGAVLYLTIWITQRKPFVVFVYSDSPAWKGYIEREILPRIQNRAVILNWSERRNWKNSLAILAFRFFGGYRNFNPIAMIFRPVRLVRTYRFYKAFKAFKHGAPEAVDKLKKELLTDLAS